MDNHEQRADAEILQATQCSRQKGMDIPRMTESAREAEGKNQPKHTGVGKATIIQRCKESHAACGRVNDPEEENNGKANQCNS
jgi:hypothetical protein